MDKKTKTFNLTTDETANIDSRQQLIKQYQYLIHTINSDIVGYVKMVVYPRIGKKPDEEYKLLEDNKKIEV